MGPSSNATAWLNFAQLPREQGGLGLQTHQAAGLVGNLVRESGPDLNPWGPSGDNGTAWGTAQWRGPRLQGLQDYARSKGIDYKSMEAQQGFMRHEMDGPENRAYQHLVSAKTPEEAASAVNKFYERSADQSGRREQAAREMMMQFGHPSMDASTGGSSMPTNTPPPDNGFMGQLGNFVTGDFMTGANGGYGLADRLGGVGAAMMALDNPKGAAAINEGINNKAMLHLKQQMLAQKPEKAPGSNFQYDANTNTFFRTDGTGNLVTQASPNPMIAKPAVHKDLSPKVLTDLSKNEEKYGTIAQISSEGAQVLDDLNSGKLDLGMVRNLENSGRNMVGQSNEQSRAYARYKQFIQKLANTEMLKANGVQTEGDAFRVMQEIAAGGANYDTAAAKEAIVKLIHRNKEAVLGNGRTIYSAYEGAYGADNPALSPFGQKFGTYEKTFGDIDKRLESYNKPAPTPGAAAPASPKATGGFRVVKDQY